MSTISASTTSTTAYKVTADTTGELVLQTGATPTTAMTIDASQNTTLAGALTIGTATQAVPSGTAPLSAARAWVNFNGTGAVAIRASGNVTSITDNGIGDYTVNLTTAMPDINYAVNTTCSSNGTNNFIITTVFTNATTGANVAPTTSAARINTGVYAVGTFDPTYVNVSIFR